MGFRSYDPSAKYRVCPVCYRVRRLRKDGTIGGHDFGCEGAGQQPISMAEAVRRAAAAFEELLRSPEYEASFAMDDWLKD